MKFCDLLFIFQNGKSFKAVLIKINLTFFIFKQSSGVIVAGLALAAIGYGGTFLVSS